MQRQQSKIQNPKSKIGRSLLLFIFPILLAVLACGGDDGGPPSNAAVADVIANSSLRPWLDSVVTTFNEAETETAGGDPAFVTITYLESGEAVSQLATSAGPTLWIPDDQVWVNALTEQGHSNFQSDCTSVARLHQRR
jgi:hypothetical protein